MCATNGRWPRLAAALGGLAVVLAMSGCGGTTSVSGKVTHDGKPVVWGGVTLVDSTGTYHQGDIKPNGTYQIDNVPTGPVKIGVTSPKPPEEKPGRGGKTAPGGNAAAGGGKGPAGQPEDPREKFLRDQGITPNQPPPPPPPGAWFALPEKARDPMTSGLTGTVAAGKPLDIDVPK